MARYSIDGQILTDIGDAIRAKKGENSIIQPNGVINGSNSLVSEKFIEGQQYKLTVTITSWSNGKDSVNCYIAIGSQELKPFDYFTVNEPVERIFISTSTGTRKISIAGASPNATGIYTLELLDGEGNSAYSYTPEDMATEIENMLIGPSDEELVITGNCTYRFASDGWNWFLEKYGNKITTKDITNADNMFLSMKGMTSVPFDLNFKTQSSGVSVASLFDSSDLIKLPKLNNLKPITLNNMFYGCWYLESIPDNYFNDVDFSYMKSLTSAYSGSIAKMFYGCRRLRKLPSLDFVLQTNPVISNSNGFFYQNFQECYCLDEILDLPISHLTVAWTSNTFTSAFSGCSRIKNLTFGESEPKKWKSQIIDLTKALGYGESYFEVRVEGNTTGITVDKKVTDDATYQALKDDPNWYTLDVAYSRYNHDSAVATINSLPDTSAYLASAGGTNTIKFKGAAGSATDGGAINTLTEEEIAVAAAKGWTITLS